MEQHRTADAITNEALRKIGELLPQGDPPMTFMQTCRILARDLAEQIRRALDTASGTWAQAMFHTNLRMQQDQDDLIAGLRRDLEACEGAMQNQLVMIRMLEAHLGLDRAYKGGTATDYKLLPLAQLLKQQRRQRLKAASRNGQRGRSPRTATASRSRTSTTRRA